jgi:putative transposase
MIRTPDYRGYRFPPDIIAHAVWLYHRFTLSFWDVEYLLAERGITLSYETVRQWCQTCGPQYARRYCQLGGMWAPSRQEAVMSRTRTQQVTCRSAVANRIKIA